MTRTQSWSPPSRGVFTIHVVTRRWWWFGKRVETLTSHDDTEWENVDRLARALAERGAKVAVHPGECAKGGISRVYQPPKW